MVQQEYRGALKAKHFVCCIFGHVAPLAVRDILRKWKPARRLNSKGLWAAGFVGMKMPAISFNLH